MTAEPNSTSIPANRRSERWAARQIVHPLPDGVGETSAVARRTILLLSHDFRLHHTLRPLANAAGRLLVRVHLAVGALPILHAIDPAIVLLDLDLPNRAAWEAADALLQDPACAPLILLTSQQDQYDARTAIRAGSLVDKAQDPAHLLQLIEETLAMPRSADVERNTIQRILIRRLHTCNWPLPLTPAHRFWGINE